MYSEYSVIFKCSFYKNNDDDDAKNDRGGGRRRWTGIQWTSSEVVSEHLHF